MLFSLLPFDLAQLNFISHTLNKHQDRMPFWKKSSYTYSGGSSKGKYSTNMWNTPGYLPPTGNLPSTLWTPSTTTTTTTTSTTKK